MAEALTYTVYWKDGTKEYIKGPDLGTALNNYGYSNRCVHNIFAAIPGADESYIWHPTLKIWFKSSGS